jgi:hypothetical protein
MIHRAVSGNRPRRDFSLSAEDQRALTKFCRERAPAVTDLPFDRSDNGRPKTMRKTLVFGLGDSPSNLASFRRSPRTREGHAPNRTLRRPLSRIRSWADSTRSDKVARSFIPRECQPIGSIVRIQQDQGRDRDDPSEKINPVFSQHDQEGPMKFNIGCSMKHSEIIEE